VAKGQMTREEGKELEIVRVWYFPEEHIFGSGRLIRIPVACTIARTLSRVHLAGATSEVVLSEASGDS